MDVILLERIEKLGHIGDVVKVKNGYARNFLLPRGKALRANEANRKVFDANRARIEAENEERRTAALSDSKSIEGASVQLIRQASNTGQLYGSVSARDLAEALAVQGYKVAKNQIVLDRPIKSIGMQEVRVALHPEVSVAVKVNVARSPEEAELQAQGIDVVKQMFEPEAAAVAEEIEPIAEPLTEAEAAQPEASEDDPAAEAEASAPAAEEPAAEAEAETVPAEGSEGDDAEGKATDEA
jgi:large subunit ribosomal protein L9